MKLALLIIHVFQLNRRFFKKATSNKIFNFFLAEKQPLILLLVEEKLKILFISIKKL